MKVKLLVTALCAFFLISLWAPTTAWADEGQMELDGKEVAFTTTISTVPLVSQPTWSDDPITQQFTDRYTYPCMVESLDEVTLQLKHSISLDGDPTPKFEVTMNVVCTPAGITYSKLDFKILQPVAIEWFKNSINDFVAYAVSWTDEGETLLVRGLPNLEDDIIFSLPGSPVFPKEQKPAAVLDYEGEKLTGLSASAGYLINNTAVSADASGEIALDPAWLGSELSIIKTNVTPERNSDAQKMSLAPRPTAPKVTPLHQSVKGGTSGIQGTETSMEYSADRVNWVTCTAGTTTAAPGSYYVRQKAVASQSFAGTEASVRINAYYPSQAFAEFTGSGNRELTIDADLGKFLSLWLNNTEVSRANYTVKSGSTIITLKESYLKTLANGTHLFRAEFIDGYSELSLKVNVPASNSTIPRTGDRVYVGLSLALVCLISSVGTGIVLHSRRKLS